MSRKRPKELKS